MNLTEAIKRANPVVGVLFSDSTTNKVYFYLCAHTDVRKGDCYRVDTPYGDDKKVKVIWTSTNCSDQEKIDRAYAMANKVLSRRTKRGPKDATKYSIPKSWQNLPRPPSMTEQLMSRLNELTYRVQALETVELTRHKPTTEELLKDCEGLPEYRPEVSMAEVEQRILAMEAGKTFGKRAKLIVVDEMCDTDHFKHIVTNAMIQGSSFWSVDPFKFNANQEIKFNTNQETNDMSSALKVKIETITFLNGSPLSSYADSALVEMIDKLETKARELARIQTSSTRIAAEIKRLNEDAATVAKYLDERTPN